MSEEDRRAEQPVRESGSFASAPAAGAPGRILAVDVGLARIGVAVCDSLQLVARPLRVIQRQSRNDDFRVLAALVESEEVAAVVCGLPLHMDGSEGDQSASTRKWAGRLAQALRALLGRPVPIHFWDERLSSHLARAWMAAGGELSGERVEHRAKMGGASDDAYAAAVILQSYIDARRRGEALDYGSIVLPPKGGGS